MELENKITFNTIYNSTKCVFVPRVQKPLKELPDVIEGKVLFINQGEYNVQSWFKPLTINKRDIVS
tara:strand:+ start:1137 stop:1334 length:198 start_codon:yes stop_codon:yes gene_type:complete